MLTLPINGKWFDMIRSGVKKEEYRERTDYYETRFKNIGLLDAFGTPTGKTAKISLRNGYRKDSPKITVIVRLSIGKGNPAWGAEPNHWYYVLRVIDIAKDGGANEKG